MDKAFIKNPVEAYEKLKEENKSLKESLKLISQTLNHTLQSEVDLYKRQIDNSVPDDWEYEEVLALVEEYIEKLKAELEQYKNVINKLAGKTIAITTYDTPIEFCDHKDLIIQLLKKEIEKLKEEKQGLIKDWEEKKNLGYEIACKNEKLKEENQILKDEFEILQNNFDSNNREWEEHTEVLLQVLTEIKEIASLCSYATPLDFYETRMKQILQKISEVIDE